MGNAKLLLAYKFENNKTTFANPLKEMTNESDVIVFNAIPTQGMKRPRTKSARERSTQALLNAFEKISNEPELSSEQIALADNSSVNIESSKDKSPKEILKKSLSKEANLLNNEASQDMIGSTEISEMPSQDLIRMLEASMQKQAIPQVFDRTQNPIIANRFFTNKELAYQAELRLQSSVTYDGRYLKIGYPMGDVPSNMGVCTDVVIRSLRGLGVDLQQRVHEDMKRHFRSYPNKWQLSRPDSNIDHRRVPNLMTYFKRAGASLRISRNPSDYHPGNIVAWEMGNGMTHIGIVSTSVSPKTGNPLIVHNIGVGPELSDILFDFKIIGHYKYGGNRDPSIHLAKVF